MRRLLVIFGLTLALASSALAQSNIIGGGVLGDVKVASGGGYTGPGDIVSGADDWYGLRAYNSATRGNALINVCNSTGGTDQGCSDMSSDPTTGALVSKTIASITCPGTNCTIKIYYDQGSKGLNLTQSTIDSRMLLLASCNGALPCAQASSGSDPNYQSANSLSQNAPYTISWTGYRPSSANGSTSVVLAENNSNQFIIGYLNSANTMFTYVGGYTTETASDNAWHNFQVVMNGGSSYITVDSTQNTASLSAPNLSATGLGMFQNSAFGDPLINGTQVNEVGFWGTAFTPTQQTNMCHNQYVYWSTGTSC